MTAPATGRSPAGTTTPAGPPLRVFSSGGGQQSIAALVLSAQKVIDFPVHLFANVGDDSEKDATLQYVRNYAMPYAADHGIELVELRRIMQAGPDKGQERTLMQDLRRPDSRSVRIPMRMANGAPGNRSCTHQWKAAVIARETRRRGATAQSKAVIGIGISLDEIGRANPDGDAYPHQVKDFPLLDLGLRRTDCQRIIRKVGLPLPPKSACWFCPMQRPEDWQNLRRAEPEKFAEAGRLEAEMIERRAELGKDPVYFTRFARPLAQAIPDGVDLLPVFDEADGACDSGWCFT